MIPMLYDDEKRPLIDFESMDKEIVDPVNEMIAKIKTFAECPGVDAETVFAQTLALCVYELIDLSLLFDRKVTKNN
jgi:hypothetical protein